MEMLNARLIESIASPLMGQSSMISSLQDDEAECSVPLGNPAGADGRYEAKEDLGEHDCELDDDCTVEKDELVISMLQVAQVP